MSPFPRPREVGDCEEGRLAMSLPLVAGRSWCKEPFSSEPY